MKLRIISPSFAVAFLAFALASCAMKQMPFHGFTNQATLERNDAEVTRESAINGPLDPMNLAEDDRDYTHHGIAYDRVEEGYYQWGAKMYARGYRDVYYVEDLAPKAFGHDVDDTYESAIETGFDDAANIAEKNKSPK